MVGVYACLHYESLRLGGRGLAVPFKFFFVQRTLISDRSSLNCQRQRLPQPFPSHDLGIALIMIPLYSYHSQLNLKLPHLGCIDGVRVYVESIIESRGGAQR